MRGITFIHAFEGNHHLSMFISLSTSGQKHRLGAQDVVAVQQVRNIQEVQEVVVPGEEAAPAQPSPQPSPAPSPAQPSTQAQMRNVVPKKNCPKSFAQNVLAPKPLTLLAIRKLIFSVEAHLSIFA